LQVIVPVSAYFLSNDMYAWSQGNSQGYTDPVLDGHVSYAFDAAPAAIQTDLMDFIKSITTAQGNISPAVFAITVGNELDQGFQDQAPSGTANGAPVWVNAASKLARTEWWMVNLEAQLQKVPGGDKVFITSPISTADLAAGPPQGKGASWFQDFVNGVTLGALVPNNTLNGDKVPQTHNGPFQFYFVANGAQTPTVTGDIPGLASIPSSVISRPYTDWYINSDQAYQDPQGYKNLFIAYDSGGENKTSWNWNWPGQSFKVPLLLLESGSYRSQLNPDIPAGDRGGKTVDLTKSGQESQTKYIVAGAEKMEEYIKDMRGTPGGTEVMGYTLFEFNDEPTRKSGAEANFGAEMMAPTQTDYSLEGVYPKATVLFEATTNAQTYAGGAIDPKKYPVQQLFAVKGAGGETLLSELLNVYKKASSKKK
jgi:hypothetical protein